MTSQWLKKCQMLRDHGQSKKYYHDVEGYNGRLDSIQAGILSAKLKHLGKWTRKRIEAAGHYDRLLSNVDDVVKPYCPDWARAVYHLYVVRVPDREGMQKHLAEAKIATGIHYPVPLHLQKAYAGMGHRLGDFPVTEKVAREIVSLPMFPQLSAEQCERVVNEIANFLQNTVPAQGGLRPVQAQGS